MIVMPLPLAVWSGVDVELLENFIDDLDDPVALDMGGICNASATHPFSGAHQQFTCQGTVPQLYGEIKGLAVGMGGLRFGEVFRIDRDPKNTAKIRWSETLFEMGLECIVFAQSQFIDNILLHNRKI